MSNASDEQVAVALSLTPTPHGSYRSRCVLTTLRMSVERVDPSAGKPEEKKIAIVREEVTIAD